MSQATATAAGQRMKFRIYKIVVLGDGGVGKSEDSYQQQCRVDEESVHLDILDTAGQPEFTAMREQYMRTGEGFILCYSVTDRRSFDEAVAYKHLIDRVQNHEGIPIVLVGNKCDLQKDRKVSTVEGQSLASKWECPFFETSAALCHYVDDAFHSIIRQIRLHEQEALHPDKSKKKVKDLKDLGRLLKKKIFNNS